VPSFLQDKTISQMAVKDMLLSVVSSSKD